MNSYSTIEQTVTLTIRVTVDDHRIERATQLADAVHCLIYNFAVDTDDLMEKVEGWGEGDALVIEWGEPKEAMP